MHIYEPVLCVKLTGLKMSMGAHIVLIFGLELSACFQSIMTESIWIFLSPRQQLPCYHVTPLSYTTWLSHVGRYHLGGLYCVSSRKNRTVQPTCY